MEVLIGCSDLGPDYHEARFAGGVGEEEQDIEEISASGVPSAGHIQVVAGTDGEIRGVGGGAAARGDHIDGREVG